MTTHYEVHEKGHYDDQGYYVEPIIADVKTSEEADKIAEETGGEVRPMESGG